MTRAEITAAVTTDTDALNHLIHLLAATADPATVGALLGQALDAARQGLADDIEAELLDLADEGATAEDAAVHVADHYGSHAVV